MAKYIVDSALALGYPTLKTEQLQIVLMFMTGKDVFGILPTGYGISLCFAILPLCFDAKRQTSGSIVVVVTPLIAIMENLVEEYTKKGLNTRMQYSSISRVFMC